MLRSPVGLLLQRAGMGHAPGPRETVSEHRDRDRPRVPVLSSGPGRVQDPGFKLLASVHWEPIPSHWHAAQTDHWQAAAIIPRRMASSGSCAATSHW